MNLPILFCWKPGDGENFGDSLGPAIINAMLEYAQRRAGLSQKSGSERFHITHDPRTCPKLLSIGSVAQFARPGDTIWGSGLRLVGQKLPTVSGVNILAVRGRLSAEAFDRKADEIACGDPALLLPCLSKALDWPVEYRSWRPPKTGRIALIPNLRHLAGVPAWPGFPWHDHNVRIVSPYLPWHSVLKSMLECDCVIATSLHGFILAEAFGVPARWISSPALEEGAFKLHDYVSATGRSADAVKDSPGILDALEDPSWRTVTYRGNSEASPAWNPRPLWNAFPWPLFQVERPAFPDSVHSTRGPSPSTRRSRTLQHL
jgi:pyruvyltransferase